MERQINRLSNYTLHGEYKLIEIYIIDWNCGSSLQHNFLTLPPIYLPCLCSCGSIMANKDMEKQVTRFLNGTRHNEYNPINAIYSIKDVLLYVFEIKAWVNNIIVDNAHGSPVCHLVKGASDPSVQDHMPSSVRSVTPIQAALVVNVRLGSMVNREMYRSIEIEHYFTTIIIRLSSFQNYFNEYIYIIMI